MADGLPDALAAHAFTYGAVPAANRSRGTAPLGTCLVTMWCDVGQPTNACRQVVARIEAWGVCVINQPSV